MHQADTIKIIFTEYNNLLCNVSYNIVNNRQTAEDIVQDVFFNLWKNLSKVNLDNSLKAYLYKATINSSINYIQRNKSKLHNELDESYLENFFFTDEGNENIEEKELIDIIQKSINSLPPKCKAIFVLNRQAGLKYKQIADKLSISPKTVENQISIALKKLRKDLKPYVNSIPVALIVLLKEFLNF